MSDVTIGAKLEVDSGGAVNSVRNFKKELKEAQQDVVLLAEKFGATSKEAANAAKKAAELQDAMGDAKSLVDAFNPDTKFRALSSTLNTVVGGFSALQGVIGLVGVESEETQKAILKVQSALAISQGVAQLQEGVQTFKNLGAVIQSTTLFQKANAAATAITSTVMRAFGVNVVATSTAFTVLKGAIIATGIGALIVGLTVAVQALGVFKDKTADAADEQERLRKKIEDTNAALSAGQKFLKNEERLDIARAKAKGASEEEIFKIQQEYRVENLNALNRAYAEAKKVDAKAAEELLQQIKDSETDKEVAQLDFETKEIERRKAYYEKVAAQEKEARQKRLKDAADENQLRLNQFTASGGPGGGLQIDIPKTQEQLQIENEAAARRAARLEEEELTQRAAESYAEFTRIHTENVNQRIANEQAEFNAKQLLANASANVLKSLSSLIGEQTAAGKVFAIASATIDTYTAIAATLKNAAKTPAGGIPGYAIAQAVATGIFGLAQVRKIISTKVPGAGGGSAPSSLSVSAPLQPTRPQQSTTTLDQDSLNAIGNATTRAFVLESDISGSQERITRLNRQARIG